MTSPLPAPALPERIRRLLERFPPTGQEKTWHPEGADERAVLLWRYWQTSDEPLPLRFANGLAHVLRQIAIAIHDDELIVGEVGLEDMAKTHPDELAQARAFWQQRHEQFCNRFAWQPAERLAAECGLSWKWTNRDGHAIPAFELVLAQGLAGLRAVATNACAQASAPGDLAGSASAGLEERRIFWQAMVTALQGLSDYILRYAALARRLCAEEDRAARRLELEHIAAACEWLAENPPRSFAEALQLVWFVHLGTKLDDGGVGHSFGRFDQYLYPFYCAERAAGRLDDAQARLLLALFWLKLNREADDIAHLSLGGQTSTGGDAANELSYLCLEVERWIKRKQPNLSSRVHSQTSPAYWRAIAATILRGAGHPAIFNDEVIVPGLLEYGFSPELARAYAQVGCVETFLPGLGAPWTDCYLNLAKCLELALNDGFDLMTGAHLGSASGDPVGFASFEALFAAYESQVWAALVQMLVAKDEYDAHLGAHAPEPLNSAFILDCLTRGQDATGGGARYLLTGVYGVGLGTTVDSLAAIHELVFHRGLIGMEALLRALRANFAGHEALRRLCTQRAPKYGNDDERADALAVRLVTSFGRQVKAYSDSAWQARQALDRTAERRACHYAMFGSVLSHAGLGARTAASANGRLAGETLSDGGSPSQGCNRRGATATLRSLAKPPYHLAPGGAALNLRLAPAHFSGPDGLDQLASLLQTYVALGGEQLQVNLVSSETLRQARRNPEAYRDLVVRVAGFTAYYVSLPPELQDEILARQGDE